MTRLLAPALVACSAVVLAGSAVLSQDMPPPVPPILCREGPVEQEPIATEVDEPTLTEWLESLWMILTLPLGID